jgi:succinate dehydrogenase hydrophobic anchor subunit
LNGSDPGRSDRAGVHDRRRVRAAFLAFAVAAIALVLLMFALALALAAAQEETVRSMREGPRQ